MCGRLLSTVLTLLLSVVTADAQMAPQLRWTKVGGETADRVFASLYATSDGRLFASDFSRSTALYESGDGGRSWREVDTDSVTFRAAAPNGDLFGTRKRHVIGPPGSAGGDHQDLFLSTDDGSTWSLVSRSGDGFSNSSSFREIAFGEGGEIYVGTVSQQPLSTHGGGLIASTDRGLSWTVIGSGGAVTAIAPGSPTLFGVSQSSDGGWRYDALRREGPGDAPPVRDSFMVDALTRTSPGVLLIGGAGIHYNGNSLPGGRPYAFDDLGISRSLDDGSTIAVVLDSFVVSTFLVHGDSLVLALGLRWRRDGELEPQLVCSTDEGLSWSRCDRGLPVHTTLALASLGASIYAATTDGLYRASTVPELTPHLQKPIERVPVEVPAKYAGTVPADRWLWVPKGWGVKVFHAGDLEQPRFLAWGPDSVLHVADFGRDRIVAMPDRDHDGVADSAIVVADGVDAHDIEFFRGAMYAAEETRVLRLVDADGDGLYESRSTFIDGLPRGGHVTRTIVFDTLRSLVFVSVGSSCNACRDSAQAVVYAFDLDGGNRRIFASGVRNAVGMTLHPTTGALWATNNGQDMQGDNVPPEWISIVRDGGFYGYPIAYSDRRYFDFQVNDQYRGLLPITPQDSARVRSMEPFSAEVTAHAAPMAIEFGDPSMPEPYRDGAFVALHGSWNRSVPSGHMIVHLGYEGPDDAIADAMSYVLAGDSVEPGNAIDWLSPCGLEADSRGNLYFTSDRGTLLVGVLTPPAGIGGVEERSVIARSMRVEPNPADDRSVLLVELVATTQCTIEIFDALGARVLVVADGALPAGLHRFELDARGLASGAYQARLSAGDRLESLPLIIRH
jgi:glucose/arabinose dehydrogenase